MKTLNPTDRPDRINDFVKATFQGFLPFFSSINEREVYCPWCQVFTMLTFILLGRLTNLALEQAREFQERDKRAADIIQKAGGKLISLYYTFGQYDFVAIIEAPTQEVMTMILFEIGRFSTVSSETMMAMRPDQLYTVVEKLP